jgi:putative transposase
LAALKYALLSIIVPITCRSRDASFCVEALEEAIARYCKPEIMNTDQGSQYTGAVWITTLTEANIKISMPLGDCME